MCKLCKIQDNAYDIFLHIEGIVMTEWAPSGQTVNLYCYKQVLGKLCECVRKKCSELWNNGWTLHQDNVLSVKQFLATKIIVVFEHHAIFYISLI